MAWGYSFSPNPRIYPRPRPAEDDRQPTGGRAALEAKKKGKSVGHTAKFFIPLQVNTKFLWVRKSCSLP